jgi:ABC-type glutathione transport system ATPase component
MAARIADEIIVMQNGRVVESGSARNVIENPANEATQALLLNATVNVPNHEQRPAV